MTSTTLVTFLGRVAKENNTNHTYRKTSYQFAEDDSTEEVAFFGWALQRRLNPGKLIILGTAGSMWDHLFEGDIDIEDAITRREALEQAVSEKAVTKSMLDALAPVLSKALNCEVRLVLIPYCRSDEEQSELLRIMAE